MDSQVVVVTGASKGIGREICKAFGLRGARVFAAMRRPDLCEPFEDAHVETLALDVTCADSVKRAIETVEERAGQIDVLVNNAGITLFAPVELLLEEELQRVLDVNTFGPLRMAQAALPRMRERRSGRIITITSTAGLRSRATGGAYDCSKQAVEGLMACLAVQVLPFGIRVLLVEPGPTKTFIASELPIGRRVLDTGPYARLKAHYLETVPQRIHEGQPPEEVAQFVVKVSTTHKPDFRNQPSQYARCVAAETLVDPTGNSWLEGQYASIQGLYH